MGIDYSGQGLEQIPIQGTQSLRLPRSLCRAERLDIFSFSFFLLLLRIAFAVLGIVIGEYMSGIVGEVNFFGPVWHMRINTCSTPRASFVFKKILACFTSLHY